MNGIEVYNEDWGYVLESAELVGIEITENTPINIALIAEIMRRLRKDDERN